MRIFGMYNYFNKKSNPIETIHLIKDIGFRNIMIWWGNYEGYGANIKYKIAETSLQIGLSIENAHAPYKISNMLWDLDYCHDKYNEAYKVYKACIEECSIFKIPTLVIHPTRTNNLPLINSSFLYRLQSLLEVAEEKEVVLAFENLKHLEYLNFIFNNIESPYVKFCFDSGHAHCYTSCKVVLELFGNRMITTHFHDNDGIKDLHQIIGDGNIDWINLIRIIDDINYQGSINFECNINKYPKMSDKDFLRKVYDRAHELWK